MDISSRLPAVLIVSALIGCSAPATPAPPTITPPPMLPTATDAPTLTPAPTETPTAVLNVTPTLTPTPDPFNEQVSAFPVPPEYVLYLRGADPAAYNSPYYTELHAVAPDGSDDRVLMAVEHLSDPVRSPGGRYVGFSAQRPYVLDLTTGAISELDPQAESAIASFFWLSDEVLYYVWGSSGAWSTWRTDTRNLPERELVLPPDEHTLVLQVPDDERLIISEQVDNTRQTVVLNWRTGERVIMGGEYWLVDLSPDQTRAILYGLNEGREGGSVTGFYIAEADLKSGVYSHSIRVYPSGEFTGFDYQPAFSPDGEHVVATQITLFAETDEGRVRLAAVSFDEQYFYETILAPGPDRYCWRAAWYSASAVIAACRPVGVMDGPSELWRLPIDGSPGGRLSADGRPTAEH